MKPFTAAAGLMESLSSIGVQYIFGVVGREADSILFNELPQPRFVLAHHEANAGFMAIAASRMSGRPQACFSTLGPGSTNLATPLATARLDRYPLLAVAAQIETHELQPYCAHQCVDAASMYRPFVKFCHELSADDDIRDVIQLAYREMIRPPIGPAFISVPNDLFRKALPTRASTGSKTRPDRATNPAPSRILERLADAINSARRPLIVVGDAAVRANCSSRIAEIARRCGIDVVSSYSAKGVLDPDDTHYLGAVTPHMDSVIEYAALEHIFADTDCLLLVGYDLAEHLLPQVWAGAVPKRVLRLSDHVNPNARQVVPDIDAVVSNLQESLGVLGTNLHTRNNWTAKVGIRERIRALSEDRKERDGAFRPEQIICALNEHYGSDYVLANDVGFHRHVSSLFFRAKRPLDFITSAGLSSFGTGLPFGIGAKLACPERNVVVIAGDVGFHSSSCELETASRLGLKLLVIVYNNCKAGLIERYQLLGHGEVNPQVLEYQDIRFDQLAKANGCAGFRVKTYADFVGSLGHADKVDGPALIELPVYYPNNYMNKYTRNFHAPATPR